MRTFQIPEVYIRVVQNMYRDCLTTVRCAVGTTEGFPVKVGLHQGSALSPFLFAIIMDRLTDGLRKGAPWTMMFADDIVLCSEDREDVEVDLERWRFTMERRGMKVSRSKTEYLCTNEMEEDNRVSMGGRELKKVTELKYLGSTIDSKGGSMTEIKRRISAGWNGWRKVTGVLCDRNMPAAVKGRVYRTCVRPAMLYGIETVPMTKAQEGKMEVAEMKMLRFSLGLTRANRVRNEEVRRILWNRTEQNKQKRNAVNIAIRRAKASYYKDLLHENSTVDPSKFWKAVKSIYPGKARGSSNSQVFEIDGKESTDKTVISNGFCSFFMNTVASLKQKSILLKNFACQFPASITKRTESVFKFQFVTNMDVEKIIKSIKRSKATGIDDLPPGLIKDAADVLSVPLSHIINMSLDTGQFPQEWKAAKIIPLHKSGSTKSFDNYRPISVLPIVSKIIEKIVHKQLMNFLDENKLLSTRQFGFRPKMSTELAATLLLDDIRKNVDKGQLVGAVFVDLSKAFDTISHSNLLTKLSSYGIDGKELTWFEDYLFNRSAQVSYNDVLSEAQQLKSGVPQGSILGPLLFVLFFNDITDVIETNIVKYADDTVIYWADKDVTNLSKILTDEMKKLEKWMDENELILNAKKGKTEVLVFGTAQRLKRQSEEICIRYKGTKINAATSYRYLGVEVDSTLNLNTNFELCYKRASGRLRLLSKLRCFLDSTTACKLYHSMIVPVVTYCGILNLKLTTGQSRKLAALHERAIRIIGMSSKECSVLSPEKSNLKRSCVLVHNILNNDICDSLQSHITTHEHIKTTRNNKCLATLPRIKTEYARKGFYYMGAKLYNDLPIDVRTAENKKDFIEKLDLFLKMK